MKCDKELVNKIRHEFTNYERLSAFYHVWRVYRVALNRVICKLILEEIDIPEFRRRVAEIEEKVDLTRPKNQKKYLKWRKSSMIQSKGSCSIEVAHKYARNNLASILQLQRAINEGRYREDLFDSFEKQTWDRGKKVSEKPYRKKFRGQHC